MDGKSICRGVNYILKKSSVGIRICREEMYNGDELVLGTWKNSWKHIMTILGRPLKKIKETYIGKKVQSEIYKRIEEPSHQWIKCNINQQSLAQL